MTPQEKAASKWIQWRGWRVKPILCPRCGQETNEMSREDKEERLQLIHYACLSCRYKFRLAVIKRKSPGGQNSHGGMIRVAH